MTELVDADQYSDKSHRTFRHAGAIADFSGVLPKGTPIAQCMPIKREKLGRARSSTISGRGSDRLHETASTIANEFAVYRREFRAPKR